MDSWLATDSEERSKVRLFTSLASLALLPQELDTSGVGELIQLAAQRGRATRPDIQLGICGERESAPLHSRLHLLLLNCASSLPPN